MQPLHSLATLDGRPARRWLSPAEASTYTGISKSWMAKLRMHGTGPAYAKLGKAVRYSVESLDAWMSEHARRSTLGLAARPRKSGG
jgi:predicted DNA-binding transcriptional regulator AlpA